MAIREDLVSSAVQFLQDPSVSSSSIENRISFLRSKNLTQEEIDASLARSGGGPPPPVSSPYQGAPAGPPAPYYQPYPPGAWQAPPPAQRRDWRDWFIMATVVGSVSYGLYTIGKRYVVPLIIPPTPEKLDQDKKTIEDKFDRAFALVEQLADDTEALKKSEEERTEKLDTAISSMRRVLEDITDANRKRMEDTEYMRVEIRSLKDAMPKALDNQQKLSDKRLQEINTELGSLKTLVSQRLSSSSSAPSAAKPPRATGSNSGPSGTSVDSSSVVSGTEKAAETATPTTETPKSGTPAPGQSSPSSYNQNQGSRASIPAWQMAFANKKEGSSSAINGTKDAEASPASS